MIVLFICLICGLIFGLGLIISGMSNPARVLNFLDWSQQWDPTLALVMGGAIAVTLPGFYWVRKRQKPILTDEFQIPENRVIDTKLILGASLFGLGWGISGFCPGPAFVAAATFQSDVLIFFVAMMGGMLLHHWLNSKGAT